jgi:uncharacterized protein YdeI (YjbR/CyaY-like superfamily)
LDADRYTHRFSPRTATSTWSRSNRERAGKLERAGLMTPAGRAAVRAAKRSGHWERPLPAPDTGTLPAELADELERDRRDAARFARVSPSQRKAYRAYVASAKQAATRVRRARKVVALIRSGGAPIDL